MNTRVGGPRGLKRKTLKNGQVLLYWHCTDAARKMGYPQTSVRIHEIDDVSIAEHCNRFERDMLEWVAIQNGYCGQGETEGTIGSLIRLYTTLDASPFNQCKWKTRQTWGYYCDDIDAAIGDVRIADINLIFAHKFYQRVRFPDGKGKGKRDLVTTGSKVMGRLRALFAFGEAMDIEGCAKAYRAVTQVKVEMPAPRRIAMTFEQAQAIIDKAIEMGFISIALGQAIQFETVLRQIDVIGEWAPIVNGEISSPYVMNGRQWQGGLLWENINDNVFVKTMSKTKGKVGHDLSYYPLVQRVLALIPPERRAFGPVIISERTGWPYAQRAYPSLWREIARAAGVPDEVWNMDSRSGGISEARASGASLDAAQKIAGHCDSKVTQLYDRDYGLTAARELAEARVAKRLADRKGGKTGR